MLISGIHVIYKSHAVSSHAGISIGQRFFPSTACCKGFSMFWPNQGPHRLPTSYDQTHGPSMWTQLNNPLKVPNKSPHSPSKVPQKSPAIPQQSSNKSSKAKKKSRSSPSKAPPKGFKTQSKSFNSPAKVRSSTVPRKSLESPSEVP